MCTCNTGIHNTNINIHIMLIFNALYKQATLYSRKLVVSKRWPLYTDFTVVSTWHTSQATANSTSNRIDLSSACATVHWVKHYRPECVLLVSKPLSFVNSCNYSSLSIDQWCCTWLLAGHLEQYSSDMTLPSIVSYHWCESNMWSGT